jgi:putative methionine-R-sulfoxide reductase with GAF domain
MVLYVTEDMQNTFKRNLPYVSLGDNLKNRTTRAHLWFEEAMAGDNSINLDEDVISLLTSSQEILQAAYDGKETELGSFTVADEETRSILKEAIGDVENLTLAAQQRWEFKNQSQAVAADSTAVETGENAGGKLDQEFDTAYEELQTTLDRMVAHVSKKVKADAAFLNVMSWISIGLIAGIFGVVSFFVYRILRKNDKMALANEHKLEEETRRVEKLSDFIEAVSAGNYSIEIDSTDALSAKLNAMRDKLKYNAEEDSRRNWATSGLAQIGDILRASDNTRELYDNIVKFVVKYTKSNQAGLFLLNDDDENKPYLELIAAYAFERKKFIEKRIDFGQGLVGQCYLEGQRIYLTQVPPDYVQITSGLGDANPRSLLIVPMKVNEKTYGVIEIASFQAFQDHEIELVEKFAESIASTVSSVKINESTRILLEKTQQQAEEMRSQEEEMRQNMEELSATQEEMLRKEREYINRISDLEQQLTAR